MQLLGIKIFREILARALIACRLLRMSTKGEIMLWYPAIKIREVQECRIIAIRQLNRSPLLEIFLLLTFNSNLLRRLIAFPVVIANPKFRGIFIHKREIP